MNEKYGLAFASGIGGAIIAALITYWMAVDEKLNQAIVKESVSEAKNQLIVQVRESIESISKAEGRAEVTVTNAEKLIASLAETERKAKALEESIAQSVKKFDKISDENYGVKPSDIADILEERVLSNLSLKNSVLAFEASNCPNGWIEYKNAYGRFIRGIDKTGKIDPDGLRLPGNLQGDTYTSHSHLSPTKTWAKWSGGSNDMLVTGGPQAGPDRYTGKSGGTETRPKNIALLFCIKE